MEQEGDLNLRKAARNQPCLIRLPGVCDGGGETTVLAHYRLSGYCGIGQKPSDLLGAFACGPCHDVVDGRTKSDFERELLRLCHAEGVMRTMAMMFGGKNGGPESESDAILRHLAQIVGADVNDILSERK